MITPSFSSPSFERILPRLALDFTTASLDPRITFTRALNTATVVNSTGSVASVNANLPRFDYDPNTLQCKGLLIEESRTNSLRNNSMVGAVVGNPGTIPTNWAIGLAGTATRQVVSLGTENGIPYLDIRFTATTAGSAGSLGLESNTVTSASSGQIWTASSYVKLVAGSLANTTLNLSLTERSVAGALLAVSDVSISPNANTLSTQRFTNTRTLNNALTIYVNSAIAFSTTGSCDFTIRIGYPQLELGAFATSVIPTTTTALTRNADVATMTGTNFSSWYNASEGTFVAKSIPSLTGVSGVLKGIAVISDGTESNTIRLSYRGAGTFGYQAIVAGSTLVNDTPNPNWTTGTVYKMSGSYKLNNYASSVNGNTNTLDTAATVPTVDRLTLGALGSNIQPLNGHLQSVYYYPQRLLNTEVQAFSK